MRYIANSSGYLQEVSFGADITCGSADCTEYAGDLPAGYASLEDWYFQEAEKLYRWKIVGGQLTLDSAATILSDFGTPRESGSYPGCYYRVVGGKTEWVNPPMLLGAQYRTTERYNGEAVYVKIIDCGNLPNNSSKLVATGIAHNKAISLDIEMHLSTGGICLHTDTSAPATQYPARFYLNTARNLYIGTYWDMSAYTARAILRFTE